MYDATKSLIDKINKIVNWAENVTCENKDEEFLIDLFQTRFDESKEELIFILKFLEG